MKRRTLLRRTGALGALALAGCVSNGDDEDGGDGGGDGTTTADPTTTPTPEPVTVSNKGITTTATGCRSTDDGETASVAVDRESSTVTVTGVLHTSTPCHRALLRSVEYERDSGTLELDVAAEDTGGGCVTCIGTVEYEAAITLSGGVPDRVVITHEGQTVSAASATEGRGSDGGGGTGSGSDGGGATPVLASSSLEVVGRRPASGDEPATAGDIEFRSDAMEVLITGEVLASDGCETAMLESVGYDAGTDTLSVAVVAETPESKEEMACTQALEAVEYRATVGFENAIPHTVEVSQEGYGGMGAGYGEASASAPTTTES